MVMNITQHSPNLSISTITNQATQSLQRENVQRDLITPPAALSQSLAEKGVASDTNAKKETSNKKELNNKKEGGAPLDNKADESAIERAIAEQTMLEQQEVIDALKQRDAEVRKHEQAHQVAGGSSTGLPTYSYTTGPDGKRYATEGEVDIDLSITEGDPAGTIAKMLRVKAAALAPINPSIQDLRVASSASHAVLQAHAESIATSKERIESNPDIRAGENSVATAEQKNTALANDSIVNQQAPQTPDATSVEFDDKIAQTIAAQENLSPSEVIQPRSVDVLERLGRIESFYHEISTAYDIPLPKNVELIA